MDHVQDYDSAAMVREALGFWLMSEEPDLDGTNIKGFIVGIVYHDSENPDLMGLSTLTMGLPMWMMKGVLMHLQQLAESHTT